MPAIEMQASVVIELGSCHGYWLATLVGTGEKGDGGVHLGIQSLPPIKEEQMSESVLKLTKGETRTLTRLLYEVTESSSGVIDLLEVFSREDFSRLGMVLEKLKQGNDVLIEKH